MRPGSSGARCPSPRDRAAAGPLGAQLIAALGKADWQTVRQRGSHVRLKHPDHDTALVVPLHRELKRGTLAGIIREAGISREELRQLL